jgi:hypothetical protein
MISEQLLRDAGWSEEVIEAVKRATAIFNLGDVTLSAGKILEINTRLVSDSNSIALNTASEYDFSWPKLKQ